MRQLLFALGLALLVSTTASAVPVLQLDIAGGTYDAADETIVIDADTFTVYAYATPSGNVRSSSILGRTHYLSVALTPETGPAGASVGSFTVNGTTYDATADMTYGVPPIEANGTAGHDGGDLGRHGIYSTHFVEIPFTFSAANRSGEYNTAEEPGSGPIAGNDMYYAAFTVDKSLLDDLHQLHFDLFTVEVGRHGDRDRDRFAPFSHDAATVGSPVPEPTAALIFGGALLLTKVSTRRRS
jgi:hypothetical protein